jgi:hypothetical protein
MTVRPHNKHLTSMSEAEFKAHYAWLDPITSDLIASQKKGGTWSERNNRQLLAKQKAESQGYYPARAEQVAIQSHPANIARWKKEAQEIIDIENKRLLDIQKEEKRIKDQIIQKEREDAIFKAGMEESARLQKIEDQMITFNEQQNSGDFNETPITEINFDNSCSECTGTIKSTDPIEEKQLTESYLKIGGIAAVGIGILLLYTRRNKK